MYQSDASNVVFDLAVNLVNQTAQHIFLTGKAGTGKTTFLHYIREHTTKKTVIVAPTGVAAINAGGVTMHSFFQLPRGAFSPEPVKRNDLMGYVEITDRHTLFKNLHLNSNKRELLQEMELLIIDEVSMLRCDMLDAIDAVLRHFRKALHVPFGGVQVVYIGDLFQLPPVVKGEEWSLLRDYYESPFFFSARALREAPPVYIELKKIYRQKDEVFISLLNRIRNGQITSEDVQLLNTLYQPGFKPDKDDHYITITTHNQKADALNREALQTLDGKAQRFTAAIRDDFSDKAYPTDPELDLKEGAQVMFIRNDSGAERRFYNGKLARVKTIRGEEITVEFPNGEELILEKETWRNVRFTYNQEDDGIDEEVLGSFTQYPVRLAWAITVHKSQGLTFEKAIIDAGASFAPGQVYVALSRCTSMEKLVLKSRIYPGVVTTDERIRRFAAREMEEEALYNMLHSEKYRQWSRNLQRLFDWTKLNALVVEWRKSTAEKKWSDPQEVMTRVNGIVQTAREATATALKFQKQLTPILNQAVDTGDTSLLKDRMYKAVIYFADVLAKNMLVPLHQHLVDIQKLSRLKKYRESTIALQGYVWQWLQKLVTSSYGELVFLTDTSAYDTYNPQLPRNQVSKPGKSKKGESKKETLDLFLSGKTVEEVAAIRRLALSTINGHLADFVLSGELDIDQLVRKERRDQILKVIEETGAESLVPVKQLLGEDFKWDEIRAVMNYRRNILAEVQKN